MISKAEHGDVVYEAETRLFHDEPVVKRYFVLAPTPNGCVNFGESMREDSRRFDREPGKFDGLFDNPQDAIEYWRGRQIWSCQEQAKRKMAEREKLGSDVARLREKAEFLATADFSGARVIEYPKDYVPIDW